MDVKRRHGGHDDLLIVKVQHYLESGKLKSSPFLRKELQLKQDNISPLVAYNQQYPDDLARVFGSTSVIHETNHITMKLLSVFTLSLLYLACSPEKEAAFSEAKDKEMVVAILQNLDSHTLDLDTKLSVYSEDVIHMGQGGRPITNLEGLRKMLEEERKWGHSEMKHEAYEIHSFEDHIIVRGGVKGTWYSNDGNTSVPFETNNLITLKRTPIGELKIWHVIFNRIES